MYNWNCIVTHGSKQDDLASFAVVKEDGTIVCNWIMTEHAEVFEAEAQTILSACDMLKNNAFKVLYAQTADLFLKLLN